MKKTKKKYTKKKYQKHTGSNESVKSVVLKDVLLATIRRIPHKRAITKLLYSVAAIELLLAGGFHLYTYPSVRQTIVLATTVQPERFTELYFEDHMDLPKDALPNKEYSFEFSVHNLEYMDIKYNYETFIENGEEKVEIDHGSFVLKHDEVRTIKQDYSLLKEIPRSKVVVNLKNKKNQQIHFWVGEETK